MKEVIERIPESERDPSIKVVEEEIVMPVECALGVIWDTRLDSFVHKVVKRDIADTRRKILDSALVILTQQTMVAEDFQSPLSHQRVDG